MANKVVKLSADSKFEVLREHMNEDEFVEFSKLCSHHTTIGHVVFNEHAETIVAENVDEGYVAAFANVFDICDALTEELDQTTHAGTLFESRKMEISCRRYSNARAVILQGKGAAKAGATS